MYADVLSIDKSNVRAMKGLRDMFVKAGKWKDAAGVQKGIIPIERSRDRAAGDSEAKLLAGIYYEHAATLTDEGGFDKALTYATRALDADKFFVPARVLLGEIALKNSDTDLAVKHWKRGYEKTGDVIFLIKLEEISIAESSPQQIISIYRDVLTRVPGNVNARLLQARLFLRLEMVDDAIRELTVMGDEGQGGAYRQVLLGAAYLRRNQAAEAAELFFSALGFDDNDMSPVFKCRFCAHETLNWVARCPSCSKWDSLEMSSTVGLNDTSVHASPLSTPHKIFQKAIS